MKLVQLSGNRSGPTMERVNLFNPSDLLWRYPMGFQAQHGPYPFLDFRTLLPNSLASDPRLWSREDVVSFLRWCEFEFDLPRFDMDFFQMNGKALCLLTKSDLNERSPGCGDVLHNVLHMLMRGRMPSSPITPHFPLTPTWNMPPAIEFPGSQNSVTLSPAPSLDSQGSPRQPDQNTAAVNNSFNSSCDTSVQRDMRHLGSSAPCSGDDIVFSQEDSQTNNKNMDHKKIPVQPSGGQSGSSGSTLSDSEEEPNSPTVQNALSSPTPQSPINVKPQVFFPSDNISEPNTNGRLLWDFLQQLLNDPLQRYTSYIAWKNRDAGVFKIVDPPGLAKLWGIQKNHLSMNYDKMSRALRYYYRVNILRKVQGERHCYQFLRNPSELKNIKHISLLRHQMSGHQTQPQIQFQQTNFQVQQQQAPNQLQQNLQTTQTQLPCLKTECEEEPTDLSTHAHCNGNMAESQLNLQGNDYQPSTQAEDLSLSHVQSIKADVS